MAFLCNTLARVSFSLALLAAACPPSAFAANDWFLLSGSNTSQHATYPNVIGMAGIPGSREKALTWTDASGYLWMYGGRGYAQSSTGPAYLSDFWKCDPATKTWYWMGGSTSLNATPLYPEKVGKPGVPGSRYDMTQWLDASGDIWMFGGVGSASDGSGRLSDLWRLNPQTLQWYYMGGSKLKDSAGNYPSNYRETGQPPSRSGGAGGVTSTGEFLLFGGNIGNGAYTNDFWLYTPSEGTWTWIAGSNQSNQLGLYPSSTGQAGYPGARGGMACWTDQGGNLWIFGGHGYSNNIGLLNDVWKYQPANHAFYWVAGASTRQVNTVFPASHGDVGTLGCRNYSCFWNADNKFWVSGGYGTSTSQYGRFADLWSFSLADYKWRFIDGPKDSTTGSYPAPGGRGVPDGRMGGLTWTVGNRLYLMGGTLDGATPVSDFWMHHAAVNSSVNDWQLMSN